MEKEMAHKVFHHVKMKGKSFTYGKYGTAYKLGKLVVYDHGFYSGLSRITIYLDDNHPDGIKPCFYDGYVSGYPKRRLPE